MLAVCSRGDCVPLPASVQLRWSGAFCSSIQGYRSPLLRESVKLVVFTRYMFVMLSPRELPRLPLAFSDDTVVSVVPRSVRPWCDVRCYKSLPSTQFYVTRYVSWKYHERVVEVEVRACLDVWTGKLSGETGRRRGRPLPAGV